MINIIVEASTPPVSWDKFREKYPKFSVALDGFVNEGPNFDEKGPWLNLNHHEGVDRLATRSTCAQALMSIRQGLFKRFRTSGEGAKATAYVNDCDEDVCTATFLLKEHFMVDSTMNPTLNRLVSMEDTLDCTAGAYPYPADLPALQELAWVFEPYRQFRLSGGLERKKDSEFLSIINDVHLRIMQHIAGRGKSIALDTTYQKIGGGQAGGQDWVMVKEIGMQARTGMFGDGVTAFVAVRERPNNRYTYTIGRLSPFIPFDCNLMVAAFNDAEKIIGDDRWGGGTTIAGSPRVAGSSLSPEEVTKVINWVLEKTNT